MGTGNLGYSERNDSSPTYVNNEELGVCEVPQGPDNSSQSENLKSQNENAKATEAVRNLGQVKSLSQATDIVGSVIDALVPRSGDKAKVEFNMNIPIHPSNTVFFSLKLVGEAARNSENNVKLRNEVQLGVMGKIEIDAWIMEIEAHLRVAGVGYIESVGSNGSEAFNFLGLAIRESVANFSERGANFLMDGANRDNLFKRMGSGEYAEAGLGIEASAGLSMSADDGSTSGGVKYRDTAATRYTSTEGSSETNETAIRTQELALSGSSSGRPKLGLSGKVKYQTIGSGYSIDGIISGDGEFSVAELDAILISTTWVSGLMTTFATLIKNGANMFGGNKAQQVGQMASLIRDTSVSSIVLSHYAHDALSRLKSFNGLNIGHKVTVMGSYSNGQFGGVISLERYSEIEFGSSTDWINLLLQNIDPVITVKF